MEKAKKRRPGLYIFLILLFIGILLGILFLAARIYYPMKYDEYVAQYSADYGLEPAFVYAVIHTESRFDPLARSHADAVGLMQITGDTLEWIAWKYGEEIPDVSVLTDPQMNIRYGCMILQSHMEEFGDWRTALAAYNAGRGRVLLWLEDPEYSADGMTLDKIPFTETERYVRNVLRAQSIYALLY